MSTQYALPSYSPETSFYVYISTKKEREKEKIYHESFSKPKKKKKTTPKIKTIPRNYTRFLFSFPFSFFLFLFLVLFRLFFSPCSKAMNSDQPKKTLEEQKQRNKEVEMKLETREQGS